MNHTVSLSVISPYEIQATYLMLFIIALLIVPLHRIFQKKGGQIYRNHTNDYMDNRINFNQNKRVGLYAVQAVV